MAEEKELCFFVYKYNISFEKLKSFSFHIFLNFIIHEYPALSVVSCIEEGKLVIEEVAIIVNF